MIEEKSCETFWWEGSDVVEKARDICLLITRLFSTTKLQNHVEAQISQTWMILHETYSFVSYNPAFAKKRYPSPFSSEIIRGSCRAKDVYFKGKVHEF